MKMGVEILEGQEVSKISLRGRKIEAVNLHNKQISCETALLASGSSVNYLLTDLQATIPIVPERTEVILLKQPKDVELNTVVLDYVNGIYFRPYVNDRIFVGYWIALSTFAPRSVGAGKPDLLRWGNDVEVAKDMQARIVRRIPSMKASYWAGGYECYYDTSPDSQPIMTSANVPTLCSWFQVSVVKGFHLSPWIGEKMARYNFSGEKPRELLPFSNSRFRKPQYFHLSVYGQPQN